jgi:hypothetical protein
VRSLCPVAVRTYSAISRCPSGVDRSMAGLSPERGAGT